MVGIHAIVTDVDGTLLRHGHELPTPSVQTAIYELQEANIPILPVTSRSHDLMQNLINTLNLQSLCVLDNGASLFDTRTNSYAWRRWISPEATHNILASIGVLCTSVCCEAGYRPLTISQLANFEPEAATPSVFGVFAADIESEIAQRLAAVPGIDTHIMRFEDDNLQRCVQITRRGVNKNTGVARALATLGLTDHTVLAIGDNFNDLSLFEATGPDGLKVAMGNAPPELKQHANYVALPVEQDGFADAMRHYGLIYS